MKAFFFLLIFSATAHANTDVERIREMLSKTDKASPFYAKLEQRLAELRDGDGPACNPKLSAQVIEVALKPKPSSKPARGVNLAALAADIKESTRGFLYRTKCNNSSSIELKFTVFGGRNITYDSYDEHGNLVTTLNGRIDGTWRGLSIKNEPAEIIAMKTSAGPIYTAKFFNGIIAELPLSLDGQPIRSGWLTDARDPQNIVSTALNCEEAQ